MNTDTKQKAENFYDVGYAKLLDSIVEFRSIPKEHPNYELVMSWLKKLDRLILELDNIRGTFNNN